MLSLFHFFFFNDTTTSEIYTLSLHDALPIFPNLSFVFFPGLCSIRVWHPRAPGRTELWSWALYNKDAPDHIKDLIKRQVTRSEEHTSELQSLAYLVCRLLLEKKKKTRKINN